MQAPNFVDHAVSSQKINRSSGVSRGIKLVVKAQATTDGAGVALFRAIGQPALPDIDPFLLLDEMHSDQPDDYIAGFPSHPHRGFETLSYMVSGEMRHRDSQGNEGLVGSGGVQWMRAARGIVHSEIPAQTDGLLWGYQLWVNLPAANKMDAPDYHDIAAGAVPSVALDGGGFIKVIAGRQVGATPGPVVREDIDLVLLDIYLPARSRHTQPIPTGHAAFAYVAEGLAEFGCGSANPPTIVSQRETAVFDVGDHVVIATGDVSVRFLLIAGEPIGEPIARHGPFVMNTKDEIRTAIHDYQTGVLV